MSDSRPAVVINADDFGMSDHVNRAILESFQRGWITSATLMPNMQGSSEACAMVRDHGLNGRIGIHLVLNEGPPLTEPIRRWPHFVNAAGELHAPLTAMDALTPEQARAVETELEAQIQRAVAAGVRPTHFDSHGHSHTRWPVSTIVMRLARRHGIRAIRLTRNCGPSLGTLKRVYKEVFNLRLVLGGFAATRYFGSAADAATLGSLRGPLEIMTHPDLDGSGRVVDLTPEAGPIESIAATWGARAPLVSFGALRPAAATAG